MDELFTITDIQPIGYGLWWATLTFRHPETINGGEVAQVARFSVRFQCGDDKPLSDMMALAYEKARECLASTAEAMARSSAETLLADWRKTLNGDPFAELDGPDPA